MSVSSADCIFCKIASNEIPSPKLYEDEEIFVIRDIEPHAKHHFLVIPKAHIESLDAAFPENGEGQRELAGRLLEVGTRVAREQGFLAEGFRSVINTGAQAGQTVFHLHLHILGGQPLRGFA